MAHAGFMIEFNRPIAYRARLIYLLEQFGLAVEEIGKTAFTLHYNGARKFHTLKKAILSVLDPKIGSATLSSSKTGRRWRVNNRGNQPQKFVRT